mmetsp:Transcript_39322/g.62822  ORF Transcript_39322/g.62822 Transcript_39322/m.62822 type:complete len:288 (-) Transcript_39322:143-1006(-)
MPMPMPAATLPPFTVPPYTTYPVYAGYPPVLADPLVAGNGVSAASSERSPSSHTAPFQLPSSASLYAPPSWPALPPLFVPYTVMPLEQNISEHVESRSRMQSEDNCEDNMPPSVDTESNEEKEREGEEEEEKAEVVKQESVKREHVQIGKRKRGRPKGSKNKTRRKSKKLKVETKSRRKDTSSKSRRKKIQSVFGDEIGDDEINHKEYVSNEEEGEEAKRKIKNPSTRRKHTAIACVCCWRAKTRCSVKRPCERCVRLGQEHKCVDRPAVSRKRQNIKKQASSPHRN